MTADASHHLTGTKFPRSDWLAINSSPYTKVYLKTDSSEESAHSFYLYMLKSFSWKTPKVKSSYHHITPDISSQLYLGCCFLFLKLAWPSNLKSLRKVMAWTRLSHIALSECMLCCWQVLLCAAQSSIMCLLVWSTKLHPKQASAMLHPASSATSEGPGCGHTSAEPGGLCLHWGREVSGGWMKECCAYSWVLFLSVQMEQRVTCVRICFWRMDWCERWKHLRISCPEWCFRVL